MKNGQECKTLYDRALTDCQRRVNFESRFPSASAFITHTQCVTQEQLHWNYQGTVTMNECLACGLCFPVAIMESLCRLMMRNTNAFSHKISSLPTSAYWRQPRSIVGTREPWAFFTCDAVFSVSLFLINLIQRSSEQRLQAADAFPGKIRFPLSTVCAWRWPNR